MSDAVCLYCMCARLLLQGENWENCSKIRYWFAPNDRFGGNNRTNFHFNPFRRWMGLHKIEILWVNLFWKWNRFHTKITREKKFKAIHPSNWRCRSFPFYFRLVNHLDIFIIVRQICTLLMFRNPNAASIHEEGAIERSLGVKATKTLEKVPTFSTFLIVRPSYHHHANS